jgi:uncharacterized membrane protein
MSVADATRRDLVRLGGEAEECSLAAVALALAAELDDQENSATSKSMIAREYRETMAVLRAMVPPKLEEDEVERARKRRADRLAGQPAAGSSSSS